VTTASPHTDTTTAAQDSREVILDAAEDLMARIGYDKTSISMICRASGLPVGSLYHHFGSKAGLLAAVMTRGADRFFAAMPQPEEMAGSPEQNMRDYWGAAADAIVANARYFYLESDLTRFGRDDPEIARLINESRQSALSHIGVVIEPFARAAGVPDPVAEARRLVSLTVTFTRGAIIEAGRDRARLRALIHDLYLILRASILEAGRSAGTCG
jgi:AcrR family transcriptional regulator